jgi:hypothetical protein
LKNQDNQAPARTTGAGGIIMAQGSARNSAKSELSAFSY